MKASTRPSLRARALAARFGRDPTGATAVEFAMVALPFLAILFGTLELGLIFMISTTLDNATSDAARYVRTGQIQNGQMPLPQGEAAGDPSSTQFKTTICNGMGWLQSTCLTNLQVSVQPYASFQSTNGQKAPITGGQFSTNPLPFKCGSPGQIVLVQGYFTWPLVAPGFDKALQTLSSGAAVITSTAVFENEPYAAGASPTC